MNDSDELNSTQERRFASPEKSVLWSRLSVSQKYSATSLSRFGYELTFIRKEDEGDMAYMLCGNCVATIDINGDINTSPTVTVRFS